MIDFQQIAVYVILAVAVLFLIRKYFWKKKKKNCGGSDCGCS